MIDLKSLSPRKAGNKGATLHLKHPATGEPLMAGEKPVTITVMSKDSDALKEKTKEIEKRRATGEEIDPAQSGAEIYAAITTGWSGFCVDGGGDFPFSFENAVKLYLDPDAEWVLEQIGPFVRSRRNFLANLSTD